MTDQDQDAFPRLGDADISSLTALGSRRTVASGEYLYREADVAYDFFIVLSGAVEIVVGSGGDERVIVRHESGGFLGELNLLTGQRVFVSARVVESGEVLVVPAASLRHVIAVRPALSDMILAAFIARRSLLLSNAGSSIRVIGSRFSPESGSVREFLTRSRIPHEWLDPDHDAEVDGLLAAFDVSPLDLYSLRAPYRHVRVAAIVPTARFHCGGGVVDPYTEWADWTGWADE